jgi:hypothetical protein
LLKGTTRDFNPRETWLSTLRIQVGEKVTVVAFAELVLTFWFLDTAYFNYAQEYPGRSHQGHSSTQQE